MSPIEFYQANLQAVEAFGMTHLADRDERQLFRLGRDMIKAQQIAAVKMQKKAVSDVTLTNEQFAFIATCYLDGLSRLQILDAFVAQFPECAVPSSSLNRYSAMLEVADSQHPFSDQMKCHKRLLSIAVAMAPERFSLV